MKIKQLKIILNLFLIISIVYPTYAQGQGFSFTGKVVDPQGAPLEFASVSLLESNDRVFKSGSLTDADGKFSFENLTEDSLILEIKYLSYERIEYPFYLKKSMELEALKMNVASNELSTVEVVTERKIITKSGDKLILNIQGGPLSTGYDGLELLGRSPSVWLDPSGEILIRDERAVVRVNGRQLNMSGGDLANYLQNIAAENIHSIEIQTNVDASQDGESAGGIIDIILKKRSNGVRGNIRPIYTLKEDGYDKGRVEFRIDAGFEKWNVYGNYNFTGDDFASFERSNIIYYTSENIFENEVNLVGALNRHNYKVGTVVDLSPKQTVGIEYFGRSSLSNTERDGVVAFRNTSNNLNEILDKGTSVAKRMVNSQMSNGVANYTLKLDTLKSTFKISADVTYQDREQDFEFSSLHEQNVIKDDQEKNDFNAVTNILVLESKVNKFLANDWQFETGLKWTSIDRNNDLYSESILDSIWVQNERTSQLGYKESVAASFVSVSKKFGNGHFLKAGLRVENTDLEKVESLQDPIEQNYTSLFPSLYYSKELPSGNSISFGYSRRLSRPSFSSLTNSIIRINDNNYRGGNPDLQPEFIDKLELNYQVKKQSFSLYLRNANNAINGVYQIDGDIIRYIPVNAGRQEQLGFLYTRSGNITKWWSLNGSANLFYRRFIDDNKVTLFPKATTYVRMTSIFKINESSSVDLVGYAVTPRYDAFYESAQRYSVNFILKKSFFDKKLSFRIYLNDLFNINQAENRRPFDTFETNNFLKNQTQTFVLWMSYNFSNSQKFKARKNKSANDSNSRL